MYIQERKKTRKETLVETNLLAMLDSLFVETEKIIMRKTYSDEGFRIIVNGVTVHKTTVCIKLNIQRS